MTSQILLSGLTLAVLFAAGGALGAEPKPDPKVVELLEPIRAKHNLAGIIGGVLVNEKLVALGAVGVRKLGEDVKLTIGDRVHIGSCTKAMTATRIAMLIEGGKLRWDSTLGETFPDLGSKLHKNLAEVTLEQLLT